MFQFQLTSTISVFSATASSPSLLPIPKTSSRMSNKSPLDRVCEGLAAVTGPLSCSFLSAGQAFTGTQSVSPPHKEEESWKLNVRILGCDFQRGYICGSMKALYVLAEDAPPVVETFWEGEIVDTKNFTFRSDKMHVRPVVDMQNWLRFNGFAHLEFHSGYEGAQVDLSMHPFIYMRWYERSDKNPGSYYDISCGGFYYVCISCLGGSVSGCYYDPTGEEFVASAPMKFKLEAVNEGRFGFSSSSYELQ